ncbi:hypothetical protein B5C34_09210 [Pacificimonas flava]|uniref:Lipoprotein n=2 Tax=Pacificimonas TaxID=1960290 RepID=A0A219B5F9_9SPHN|nr:MULTISPECIES: hypothetical protein [Pacificimonas]MBZ6379152.1 hypothetical protein [Pacificimonas aurantium]OWV33622.1 hypothetical protein B5C34_09210 [Pacificimonas flava]
MRICFLAVAALPLLSGCIVERAVDVVTLPVKAGSKAVDLATTSEEERDAKFIRQLRKACEQWEDAVRDARRDDRDPPPPPNGACT